MKMIGLNSIHKMGVFAKVPSILPPPKQKKSPAASVGECPLGFLPALEFHNFGDKKTVGFLNPVLLTVIFFAIALCSQNLEE